MRLGATGSRAIRRTRRRRRRTWRGRRCRTIGRGRRRRWPVPPVWRRRRRRGWRRCRLGVAKRDCRDRGHCGDADCSGDEVAHSCLDLRGCREDCGGNCRGDDLRGAVDDLVHGWLLSCACDTNNNASSRSILSRFVLFFFASARSSAASMSRMSRLFLRHKVDAEASSTGPEWQVYHPTCPNCRATIPDAAMRFCGYCGAKLDCREDGSPALVPNDATGTALVTHPPPDQSGEGAAVRLRDK